jgi:hypothetical protein
MLVTLMMEALSSSETSVLKRATRRNLLEDGILHSLGRGNLKSYQGINVSSLPYSVIDTKCRTYSIVLFIIKFQELPYLYTSKLYVQFGVMVSSSGAALMNLIFK